MTDDTNDPRAEQAFRTALNQRADALETVPLDAGVLPRRRRWLPGAVAAAVLILVGGTALAAGVLGGDGGGDGKAAVTDKLPAGALPVADEGWRWVSWHDVAVQVPDSWAYGVEPFEAWCVYNGSGGLSTPAEPYVALDGSGMMSGLVGCIGEAPDHHPAAFGRLEAKYWAPHLAFGPGFDGETVPDGTTTFAGWTLTVQTVGDVQVRLITDPATAHLTERILGSATTFDVDQNGCDATSPVQAAKFVRPTPAFDVTSVAVVDSISVCSYPRTGTAQPGLSASRLITGTDADALLSAIQDAPTGGGPDTPQTCVHDMYGDTGLAVRLHTGSETRDLYVYADWCFGNGFDDGTTRRELTVENCVPLFSADPVRLYSGSSAPFSRCHE